VIKEGGRSRLSRDDCAVGKNGFIGLARRAKELAPFERPPLHGQQRPHSPAPFPEPWQDHLRTWQGCFGDKRHTACEKRKSRLEAASLLLAGGGALAPRIGLRTSEKVQTRNPARG
jgi:hypothetical protein